MGDQLIYIPLPDLDSRISIFRAALRKSPVSNDIDFRVLARSTSGFSGADIKEVCIAASKCAIHDFITRSDEKLDHHERNNSDNRMNIFMEEEKDLCITKRHRNCSIAKFGRSVSDEDL